MDAFGWLGQLVEWVGSWVPRLEICRATHKGVKFVRGKHVRVIEPGLYLYWPITTECDVIPVVRQSVDLASQVLTTDDEKTVMVSAVLVYEVSDVEKALARSHDVDDTITEVAAAVVAESVTPRTFQELRTELHGEVRAEMTKKCNEALIYKFGIRVLDARLTDLAIARVIRTVGDRVITLEDDDE